MHYMGRDSKPRGGAVAAAIRIILQVFFYIGF
jgi:hypothetical protein